MTRMTMAALPMVEAREGGSVGMFKHWLFKELDTVKAWGATYTCRQCCRRQHSQRKGIP